MVVCGEVVTAVCLPPPSLPVALLRYVDSLLPIKSFRDAFPILFEVPFSSATKTALVLTRE